MAERDRLDPSEDTASPTRLRAQKLGLGLFLVLDNATCLALLGGALHSLGADFSRWGNVLLGLPLLATAFAFYLKERWLIVGALMLDIFSIVAVGFGG